MSFKLLEINILSAQDLAPVSKLLRTFAVAWVHPDQKLTTRVDHHGNTNPTWNYRFVFGLNDPFLSSSSSSALTVEIYNVSWLRDIPIGSVHAPIASILPPPSQTKAGKRFVSLQIRRPSGALQGTLNLGVNVVDSPRPRRSVILDRQLSAPSTGRDVEPTVLASRSPHKSSKRNHDNLSEEEEEEKKNAKISKLSRSQSDRTDEESSSSSLSKSTSSIFTFSRKPKVIATPSICSYKMRPLPSEVAASMAKGLYSTSSSGDIGSSVFENWTVVGGEAAARRKSVRWKNDDEFMPSSKRKKKKNRSAGGGGGGLLSCFGILCGYECNIFCGKPKSKKKEKKRRVGESSKVYVNHPVEKLDDLLYYR